MTCPSHAKRHTDTRTRTHLAPPRAIFPRRRRCFKLALLPTRRELAGWLVWLLFVCLACPSGCPLAVWLLVSLCLALSALLPFSLPVPLLQLHLSPRTTSLCLAHHARLRSLRSTWARPPRTPPTNSLSTSPLPEPPLGPLLSYL